MVRRTNDAQAVGLEHSAIPPDPDANQGRHTVIDHSDVGHIALDRDTLFVAGDDLRITIDTAAPYAEVAERLALAIVLGTQTPAMKRSADTR